MIKHIWFDFSETIASINEEPHNRLRYTTYAALMNKPVTDELIQEYETLYEQHAHSNAAVFPVFQYRCPQYSTGPGD